MKISKAIIKELTYIALGTILLSGVLLAVLFFVGRPFPQAIYGVMLGGGFSVLNFFILGLTVQKAINSDPKNVKNMMQLSYSLRMLATLFIGWLGFSNANFDGFAVIISLFFPRIVILLMTFFRKDLKPENSPEENN